MHLCIYEGELSGLADGFGTQGKGKEKGLLVWTMRWIVLFFTEVGRWMEGIDLGRKTDSEIDPAKCEMLISSLKSEGSQIYIWEPPDYRCTYKQGLTEHGWEGVYE